MLFSVDEVMAISVSKGSYVNFSTYGLAPSGTTHSRTSHKKSDDKDAYCIQIKKNFTAGTYTSSNCNANGINNGLSSTHYIVAGQIIDIIDKKILKILSENADVTTTEICNLVNLSVPAVNKRILRMQKDGIIKNFTIITNPKKLDKTITAFIFIVMK